MAALIRGIDQAAADKLAADLGISVKLDEKAGGYVISRKQMERVQAALGQDKQAPAKPDSAAPDAAEWRATPENFPFADSEAGNPGARARRWLAAASDETILAAPDMGLSNNWLRAERRRRKIGDYAEDPSTAAKTPKPDSPRARREKKAKKAPPAAIVTQMNDDFGNWYVPEGSILKSTSGRELAPAPSFSTENNRKTRLSITRQREWLIDEVRKEAEARGDRHMQQQLEYVSLVRESRSAQFPSRDRRHGQRVPVRKLLGAGGRFGLDAGGTRHHGRGDRGAPREAADAHLHPC